MSSQRGFGLGATEAVQTPLTIKTVATLFPPDKRSFAFGVGTAIAGLGTIGPCRFSSR